MGKQWKQWWTLIFWAPKSLQMVMAAMRLKDAYSLDEKLRPAWTDIKKQKHYFANKGPSSQSYGFSSDHVWMWDLDYKERWVPKNWYFWTVVMEKTLESPLDCEEIQPAHPKRNQSWILIGRTDVEAETPVFWPPDVKNRLIWKTLILGKIEGGRRRGKQRMKWLDGIVNSNGMSLSKTRNWWWTGRPGKLQSMKWQRLGHNWVTELNRMVIILVMATAALKSPTMS